MPLKIDRALIFSAYRNAGKRVLFLDYDGTLVPFHDLPGASMLNEDARKIIVTLSEDPRNSIYIISGRTREFLAGQFEGLRVGLIAEHGFLVRGVKGGWAETVSVGKTWKKAVANFFYGFTLLYPGSFIEEKESSVAYHYRTAKRNTGHKVKPVIKRQFALLQKQFPGLELLNGNKVIEVKPESYNKGRTAARILQTGNYNFILAAGDDLTDEQLFHELPEGTVTIKVGSPPTCARFRIASQEKFLGFLRELHPS